jgi:hypothetical protein
MRRVSLVRESLVFRRLTGSASTTDEVRGNACGLAWGAAAALAAAMAAQIAWAPQALVAWLVAVGLVIGFPIGLLTGFRRAGALLAAPGAGDGIVVPPRRRGIAAGLMTAPAVMVGVSASALWGNLAAAGEPLTAAMVAEAVRPTIPVLAGTLGYALVVWRQACEVERRWPVRMIRHRPPGLFGSVTIYAVHEQTVAVPGPASASRALPGK